LMLKARNQLLLKYQIQYLLMILSQFSLLTLFYLLIELLSSQTYLGSLTNFYL
jgi:hypothetical protein